MAKAQIRWNQSKTKYELVHKGEVLARSKRHEHLEYLVKSQKHPRVTKHHVTEVEIVSTAPTSVTAVTPAGQKLLAGFSIDERFQFTEQLVYMVINGTAKSALICGEGGVGKTHLVLKCLDKAGKENVNKYLPTMDNLMNPKDKVEGDITAADDEATIEAKATAKMDKPKGDFKVIRGHTSAKGLYRQLFENHDKILIFDDCDSVWKDGTSTNLLKSALDSYEERWISWYVESLFDTDLPSSFQFKGSIIFISNLPLDKIDEAVKTRCFKVDITMSKEQRIARLRSQLPYVMADNPTVTMAHREEALKLMEDHLDVIQDVNFRSLMNVISIRIDPTMQEAGKSWERLALFSLLER